MPTIEEIKTWRGQDAHGRDGDKLGTIEDIYLDRETGEPEWVAIRTGLFGTKVSFAPLADARLDGGHVELPYDKAQVKDAPNAEADGELSPEEERRLYEHYGHDFGSFDYDRGQDDDAMTRSEEELNVGTRERETGRARLRKYVVTENVEQTVPVTREEVRVEREPITDANRDAALSGPEIAEREHEVTLHASEPVVEKRVVPKERVRMDKETVSDERAVSEEVRRERIETDGDTGRS